MAVHVDVCDSIVGKPLDILYLNVQYKVSNSDILTEWSNKNILMDYFTSDEQIFSHKLVVKDPP
jgi:hypothetical protein